MSASRLQRLRAMRREEIAFRVRVAGRTHVQRLTTAVRRPRWRREQLLAVLAPGLAEGTLARAAERRDWTQVHAALAQTLRSRPGRFVIDAHDVGPLREAILRRWPNAASQAVRRANQMLQGEHDLLGYHGLRFAQPGQAIDWHLDPVSGHSAPRRFWADVAFLDARNGDHKVIWEINRHQHWVALGRAMVLSGDRRYRVAILEQLAGWLAANPPLVGINWASMLELAFRSLSWVATLHLLLGDPSSDDAGGSEGSWLVDMLLGLDRQLAHIEDNLSHYFSPNTHLLGEALALYVTGLALPELRRAPRLVEVGRRILLEQLEQQVEPDGGHAERSLHYHRYTLDFYMLAWLAAERCGDSAAPAFRAAAHKLAYFLRELADDNGDVPQIGDDDGGALWAITGRDSDNARDSLALAAVALDCPTLAPWGLTEEAFWLAWSSRREHLRGESAPLPPAAPAEARTTAFPDTGYVVLRDGAGGHLVFDAGPHGFLNGGHAHADALAVTLTLAGRRLLVDPGTSTYTGDAVLRDRLRRTMNHNTLALDGRSSSLPAGPFHWRSQTDARLAGSGGRGAFGWADGCHDGYPGFRHRRIVVHGPHAGWLVIDDVSGAAPTQAQLHWHFDPLWSVTVTGQPGAARAPRRRRGRLGRARRGAGLAAARRRRDGPRLVCTALWDTAADLERPRDVERGAALRQGLVDRRCGGGGVAAARRTAARHRRSHDGRGGRAGAQARHVVDDDGPYLARPGRRHGGAAQAPTAPTRGCCNTRSTATGCARSLRQTCAKRPPMTRCSVCRHTNRWPTSSCSSRTESSTSSRRRRHRGSASRAAHSPASASSA